MTQRGVAMNEYLILYYYTEDACTRILYYARVQDPEIHCTGSRACTRTGQESVRCTLHADAGRGGGSERRGSERRGSEQQGPSDRV